MAKTTKGRQIKADAICEILADTLNQSGRQARLSTYRYKGSGRASVETPEWEKYLTEKSLARKIATKLGLGSRLKQRGDTVYCVRNGETQTEAYYRTASVLAKRRK